MSLTLLKPLLGESSLELLSPQSEYTPQKAYIAVSYMIAHASRSTHFMRWAQGAFPNYTVTRSPEGGIYFRDKSDGSIVECLWGELCICVDGVPFVQALSASE